MIRANIEAELEANRAKYARHKKDSERIAAIIEKLGRELRFHNDMVDLAQMKITELEEVLNESR